MYTEGIRNYWKPLEELITESYGVADGKYTQKK